MSKNEELKNVIENMKDGQFINPQYLIELLESVLVDKQYESEREIAELKANNETLVKLCNKYSQEIARLEEILRLENFAADGWANAFYNAFQYIKNIRNGVSNFDSAISNLELCEKDCQLNWNKANALSKTPVQSLQEHDNELIEKCANVCDINRDLPAGYSAKEIRALKGTI